MRVVPECEVGSMPLLISMITDDLGLGFLPKIFAMDAIDSGRLCVIKLDEPLPPEHICLIKKRDGAQSSLAERFAHCLDRP